MRKWNKENWEESEIWDTYHVAPLQQLGLWQASNFKAATTQPEGSEDTTMGSLPLYKSAFKKH